MIFGIGTDIVHVPRMQALLDKHDDKIALRILTDDEFEHFKQSAKPAAYLAKRFAAKEAVAKAFGTGFRGGLSLRHIGVTNDENGKPELRFCDYGETLLQQFNIKRSLISLSDEGDYALAYVTLIEG